MVQPVQQVDESRLTRSLTRESQQLIVQSAVADQTPARVPIAMLWLEREAAIQQGGLLYEARASSAAIEEAVAIMREACIVFKHDKHLEQAGFNPSEPRITIEQGEDHNHPLGEADAPRQSVHVHALLPALPVNPSIPEQVLHPVTPHRALRFDDQLQLTLA
jgi:hypothetical protein